MPVKKPKETPPSTVRGKIEAIQIKRGAIEHGIRAIEASIEDKIKENAGYVKNFYG